MSSQVSITELKNTITRMENRLRMRNDSFSIQLLNAYDELMVRFKEDLGDERDELLSRGGALMLIQQILKKE